MITKRTEFIMKTSSGVQKVNQNVHEKFFHLFISA